MSLIGEVIAGALAAIVILTIVHLLDASARQQEDIRQLTARVRALEESR